MVLGLRLIEVENVSFILVGRCRALLEKAYRLLLVLQFHRVALLSLSTGPEVFTTCSLLYMLRTNLLSFLGFIGFVINYKLLLLLRLRLLFVDKCIISEKFDSLGFGHTTGPGNYLSEVSL